MQKGFVNNGAPKCEGRGAARTSCVPTLGSVNTYAHVFSKVSTRSPVLGLRCSLWALLFTENRLPDEGGGGAFTRGLGSRSGVSKEVQPQFGAGVPGAGACGRAGYHAGWGCAWVAAAGGPAGAPVDDRVSEQPLCPLQDLVL